MDIKFKKLAYKRR